MRATQLLNATIAAALLISATVPALAQGVDPVETELQVERVKPHKEKHETLRFLKANRDFIRARFDLLREKHREVKGEAGELDPRYLAYQQMLADILAAQDVTAAADDAQSRQELLASITELGSLEAQLDVMDQLLVQQRTRLAVLQDDFTGDQKTALMVLVSGYPAEASITQIDLQIADGTSVHIPLSAEQQASLRSGGIVEVFHGFVEPREQVVEITLQGASWPTGDTGFVTLEPARDRLTFLKLDVSTVHAAAGAPTIQASTWLHETRLHSVDG